MSLKLEFLGADGTVTGSRTLLTYRNQSWLVDCGLFQGEKAVKERNWLPFNQPPRDLAGVLLTHAHLDHSGYLPRLCREGFRGQVHTTTGTLELSRILLLDAAHLEEETAAFANRTRYSRHYPAQPLFTTAEAESSLRHLVAHPRESWFKLADGLTCRFLRAGHIIGASIIQLAADLGPRGTVTVTFSGDLGNSRSLHLRPPDIVRDTDILILESTYGDRLQPRASPLDALATIANRTFARGGVMVVPAFAVGRAQELTYMLRLLENTGKLPSVPVILDSPMAAAAMEICLAHAEDQVLSSAFAGSGDPFRPKLFEVTESADESMLACMRDGPMVVISASGMLNGGRILHHLKARLPNEKNTVLFTGYQAEGTKGRYLQDQNGVDGTASVLRIHHDDVPVAAEIVTLEQLSSHADYDDILAWLGLMEKLPSTLILNHGTPAAQAALAGHVESKFGIHAAMSATQKVYTL